MRRHTPLLGFISTVLPCRFCEFDETDITLDRQQRSAYRFHGFRVGEILWIRPALVGFGKQSLFPPRLLLVNNDVPLQTLRPQLATFNISNGLLRNLKVTLRRCPCHVLNPVTRSLNLSLGDGIYRALTFESKIITWTPNQITGPGQTQLYAVHVLFSLPH
jgi:hypothetical protein